MTTPTADAIAALQGQLDALAVSYQNEESAEDQAQAQLLTQLTAAQNQLTASQAIVTADQAQHTADQAQHAADLAQHNIDASTIATLLAQITALQGQVAPVAAFPKLLWHDEFDGSVVDTTKWNVRNMVGEGNDSSIDLARNVSVQGGMLVIQPKREAMTTSINGVQTTRQYTTGYIDSHGKLTVPKKSYTEFRSRLPLTRYKSAGMWPAIWFRLLHGSLEIDLMEAWGTPSKIADTWGHFQFAIWPDTMSNTNGFHGWYEPSAQDLTGWHTYGLQIDADGTLSFRYDNAPVGFVTWPNNVRTVITKITPAMIPGLGWDPATDQLGIRINLQVGQPGYYGDPTADTDFTQHYDTDWVRCWIAA